MDELVANRTSVSRMSPAAPNRSQIDYWNGPRGQVWVDEQELRDRELAVFGDAAVRAAAPRSGERVVDIGCGCGVSVLALAEAVGPEGSVLGVDVSKPMLARAAQRAAGLASVRLELADAATYAFDGTADLVFSRFGVMFFDDPTAAFTNLRRALGPAGRLAFVCWRSLAENAWMNVVFGAIRPLVAPGQPPAAPDAPGPLAFADPVRVRAILEASGFVGIALDPVTHSMPLGGNRGLAAAAADALTVGPAARLLVDATGETRALALAAATRALEPYLDGDRVELDGAAWIVTARAG
jgi:SAM-dependent methyltransferase